MNAIFLPDNCLIFKIIDYVCHDTYILDIRCVIVSIRYSKLALCGCLDLAQLALGIFCKLLGSLTCIYSCLFNHDWFDFIQARK